MEEPVSPAAGNDKAGDSETNYHVHGTNASSNASPDYRFFDNKDTCSQLKTSNNQFKRQSISIVFNESKIELTEPMLKLLNRGLNFIVLPYKLDITQTLVEFDRFERSIIWHEYWFGQKNLEEKEKPLYKTQKNYLPNNYTVPQGLKTFLSAIKSEIIDPKNRNSVPCNIPPEEIAALKELIRLQKERIITIKACEEVE